MTRAQQTVSLGLLVSSIYLAFFLQWVPISSKVQDEIIPVIPFWALVSFGSFLLGKLGWGVFTFNDVPDAYRELVSEIEDVKQDLKSNGINVG